MTKKPIILHRLNIYGVKDSNEDDEKQIEALRSITEFQKFLLRIEFLTDLLVF